MTFSDGLLGFPQQGGFNDRNGIINTLYVSQNGDDSNSGLTENTPLRTIRAAADRAVEGTTIFVRSGVYREVCPIRLKKGVSVFGDNLRTTIITPDSSSVGDGIYRYLGQGQEPEFNGEDNSLNPGDFVFLLNDSCYLFQLLFIGHSNFVGTFEQGAVIRKSPYVQNCTSITSKGGGGLLVDGDRCSDESRTKSMVLDAFTQINTDGGVGFLLRNEGYAQLVSCFGVFCYYHVKAESGASCNLSNSVTDFGEISLYSEGYGPNPYQNALAVAPNGFSEVVAARVQDTDPYPPIKIEFDGQSAKSVLDDTSWLPAVIGSLYWFEVDGQPITDSEGDLMLIGVIRAELNQNLGTAVITSSDPAPQMIDNAYLNGIEDSLANHVNNGTTVRIKFHLRSIIGSSSHGFEYVGSGVNYFALPQFGGQVPATPIGNTILEENFGRVFFTGTDEIGNFRVGAFFQVDQLTGSTSVAVDNFDITKLRSFSFQENGEPRGTITGMLQTPSQFQNDEGSNTLAVSSGAIKAEFDRRFAIQIRDLRDAGDINGQTTNEIYNLFAATDRATMLIARVDNGSSLDIVITDDGGSSEPLGVGEQILFARLGEGDVALVPGNANTEIISSNDRNALRILGSTAQLLYLGIRNSRHQYLLNGDLAID